MSGGSNSSADISWLVADQLGTPRMIADRTGSLAGISRHDYLPFGEELQAGVGGRTTNQGYSQPSGIRQGFTGYEKDAETGLNFAQARYHSPAMGRFTSPDPLIASAKVALPQSWNRYIYALNNPLRFVDPSGLEWRTNDETNELKWYYDDDDRTGTTEYTDSRYRAPDGRLVDLNPNGPDRGADPSNRWLRHGWDYVTQVEAIIWESTFPDLGHIAGWGGHVSYNIDGQSWSWEWGGWATDNGNPVSIEDYLADQTYRSGTGYVLDGGAEWNRRLAEGIMHGQDNVDNGIVLGGAGGYNLIQNNCGEPFCRAVNNMGGLPRNNSIAPWEHRSFINNNLGSFIRQVNQYPRTQVATPDKGPMIGYPLYY